MQGARSRSITRLTRRCTLGGGAQRLQPVEEEYEHSHHRDRSGDAGPHSEVERCKQREDVDLLFGLSQQDTDTVVEVTLAKIHNVLPFWCDGDGRHRQVGSLQEEGEDMFGGCIMLEASV